MINRIRLLSKNQLVRNVATVATGTAISQLIVIAFAPFITRIYGPEAFGLQALFMSVTGLLSVVAALGYPGSIVLPKRDHDASALARLSIYIGITAACFAAFVLTYAGSSILRILKAESLADYLYLIPIAMVVSVISAVLGQWLIRKKEYMLTAKYGVVSAFITGLAKVILGVSHPLASTLIVTNVVGNFFSAIFTYLGWKKSLLPKEKNNIDRLIGSNHELLFLAKKYNDFPLFRTPQNLINSFSHSLPVLLLASYFGASSAGQYSIAISVLGVPATLIGGSVMAVFYPRINEAIINGENVKQLIVKATLGLALTGALPFLVIILIGPTIFSYVFGKDWYVSGVYAQWLAIWVFFQYINKPAVSAIPALRIQGRLLIYEVFSSGLKIIALWVGYSYFEDGVIAIALFSISGVIAYIWLIIWVLHHAGKLSGSNVNSKE